MAFPITLPRFNSVWRFSNVVCPCLSRIATCDFAWSGAMKHSASRHRVESLFEDVTPEEMQRRFTEMMEGQDSSRSAS